MAKILHIIPRMVQGGAEQLLLDYLRSAVTHHDHEALVLFSDSNPRMVAPIASQVIERTPTSYSGLVRDIWSTRRWIASQRPDAVVAWMYHAAVLAPFLVPRAVPVLAYLHNTDLSDQAKRAERMAQKALSRIARAPRMSLLYSGEASRRFHEDALGYPRARAHMLPNGISLEAFAPDPARRETVRADFGIDREAFTFGCFGRFNPQKNWPLVLDALAAAKRENPAVRLIAAGRGAGTDNPDFAALVSARGLEKQVVALDAQSDMARLYDAIDALLMGSAYGEAFPLVLLETLAMGKPAIATALGSIPEVLDGLFPPVPVSAPERFVATAVQAATGRWQGLTIPLEILRDRSVSRYGLEAYAQGFDAVLDKMLSAASSREKECSW
ncbi:glycosyltransferase involved in cell wall biosynthesis [Rhodobacter sp. 140A]|nr:glycosyltransferase involved in cell wall biosynthesis [Rhodobacter sp. 140A]